MLRVYARKSLAVTREEIMKEKPFYQSKKFWTIVSGCAVVLGKELLGLDAATTTKIVGLLSAYAIGQGLADVGKNAR